jgi:light-regulated signal transduction histidine kinase (bacteriophytochrome)
MGRTKDLEGARVELEKINRELDIRVRQRTRELEASNMELEAFSYSVSHDLRAPLRHISAYAGMILGNGGASKLSPANLRHTQLIVEAVQKMGGIIEALLELTRVTHSEIHSAPVDLTSLAREVFAEVQQAEPHRMIDFDIAPGLVANGDQRLLRVVLMNLLGNAFKFTAKKDGGKIQFSKTCPRADAAFFIRDNGAGFDMAYADKLFGAFQRLHHQNEFNGTGIGLATVQRIIHRHNGKTWAESAPNQGATFFFTLGGTLPKSNEPQITPRKGAS